MHIAREAKTGQAKNCRTGKIAVGACDRGENRANISNMMHRINLAAAAAILLALGAIVSPAIAQDAVGTTKAWGSVDVTLKAVKLKGKTAIVDLLLKNNSDAAEPVSSMIQFALLSAEGDKGEFSMESKCDGAIPPRGLLKCRIAGSFESAPSDIVIQVGAGFDGEPTYFNVTLK
jgi:hypothetical protein